MSSTERSHRLLWFFGLWLASVAALAVVAGLLRWLLGMAIAAN